MSSRAPTSFGDDEERYMLTRLADSLDRFSWSVVASQQQHQNVMLHDIFPAAPPEFFDPIHPHTRGQLASEPYYSSYPPPPVHGAEATALTEKLSHHLDANLPWQVENSLQMSSEAPAVSSPEQQPAVVRVTPSAISSPEQQPAVVGVTPSSGISSHQHVIDLQRSLDNAIAFIHGRDCIFPFLVALEAADCHSWSRVVGHLSALAWRHLAVESLKPRSSEFWISELTRLYLEYIQKGVRFEAVPILLGGTQVFTCLDDKNFTDKLISFLVLDAHRHLISRLAIAGARIVTDKMNVTATAPSLNWTRGAIHWKGDSEGFPLFHDYEDISHLTGQFLRERTLYFRSPYPECFLRWAFLPGQGPDSKEFFGVFSEVTGPDGLSYLQPIRHLNIGLATFGCSVLLTCLDFAANKPRRRADNVWKKETMSNISQVTLFFHKIIAGKLENVSDQDASDAFNGLLGLASLQLYD